MNYKNIINNPFQGKRTDHITTVAIVSGLAIGAVIGALFATEKGKNVRNYLGHQLDRLFKNQNQNVAHKKLGNLIDDVRGHVKQSADGLLGAKNHKSDVSAIHVDGTPTNAWKNPKEKSAYPKTPDPSIRIV